MFGSVDSCSLHSDSPLDVRVKSHMVADMFNIAGFQIPDARVIRPLRKKYLLRYQVDGADVGDYEAGLLSTAQEQPTTTTTDSASAQSVPASVGTTVTNGDTIEDDQSSDSSSEIDSNEEDEQERPFYVTDRRIACRKLTPNERSKHIYYSQNYQNEVCAFIHELCECS